MSKKVVIAIFTLFLILIGVKNINAIECNYKVGSNPIKITISRNSDGKYGVTKEGELPSEILDVSNYASGGSSTVKYNILGEYNFLKAETEGCYNSIYVCRYIEGDSIYYALFGSALDPTTEEGQYASSFDKTNYEWWQINKPICTQVELDQDQKDLLNKQGKLISYCDRYDTLFTKIKEHYEEYKKCESSSSKNTDKVKSASCRGKALSEVEKYTNMLKNSCNSIVQNSSISTSDGCVQSCLKATKELADLQEKYIGSTNVNGETCSLSGRLVIWISNIIKWVKYIVPVIVIVLGILDFIKAIGADKDDEMKKAQGKFVKRLIAAALVFIIPFILQFVLEKLGFAANGCGIIDL